LPVKLRAELPGILNWAIQGCLAWQRDGLGIPEEVTAATNEYQAEMDVLGAFLTECCAKSYSASVKHAELLKEYHEWCEENREFEIRPREFTKRLKERGFAQDRGTGGYYVWRGIRIKTAADAALPSLVPSLPSQGPKAQAWENSTFDDVAPGEEVKEVKNSGATYQVRNLSQKAHEETIKNGHSSFTSSLPSLEEDELIFDREVAAA
jgi:phage/plasmid-associated DNA primase